ncbi:pentatricopeptide repeat-containing protein At2g36240 isoform X1 [Nymphaea colorata]|uniref:pentatricopeptide repeat-containing protein At2g36240 isoform X1 n=1 Tax=Nymphaea colorata TaxID=210225 RepID=UPI00214F0EC9|nr:pentatricopeptide repeat-containing protein At2g36240 isoform X1 [Nymphaea colorata]XP_049936591.1 pentatricopeptide repeat-containing protein At2g36240 isoform X1 [Nymphaea colorata]XP_049936592.1 pentatricopeptide repeat-containing protein At2g36240 isoform X1 [Nymphaea colorata]XP_049936593.1 pentatricopeptide repeat-containing protein At2g36240 isoform X1 [Nymphaea colorata]XP_049936594.1 pentatricopeptide repeat-containing protein At2g36240 isoform X1 [Nymphaea colorata]XP_049936595.1 
MLPVPLKRIAKCKGNHLQPSSLLKPSLSSPSEDHSLAQLSQLLKLHLKPTFSPKDLLSFLKKKLYHHPTLNCFDLHVFHWASGHEWFTHDHSTYEWTVKNLARTDRFMEIPQILDCMLAHPCPCSQGIFSCPHVETIFTFAINTFCKLHRLDEAMVLFSNMRKAIDGRPSVVVYNMLLSCMAKCRRHESAIEFYASMLRDKVKPDIFTFNILVSSYCRNSQFDSAIKLFKEMRTKGCVPNVVTFNTLIQGLFRDRKMKEGIGIAYEMVELGCGFTVVSLEILLGGLCREGMVMDACEILHEFSSKKGVLPQGYDCLCIVNALCLQKNVEKGMAIVGDLWSKGHAPSAVVCITLLEELRKLGKLDVACTLMERMFNEGILPDIITFNCLLQCLCDVGRASNANRLKILGSRKGMKVDASTLHILVRGFSHEGRGREGLLVLDEMLDKGFISDLAVYNRLQDGINKFFPCREQEGKFKRPLVEASSNI